MPRPQLDLPGAVHALRSADPSLDRVIAAVGPCTLAPAPCHPYRALFEAIVHQQLSGAAAGTILRRVRATFPPRRFPRPADVLATPQPRLRAAGLSRQKIAAIRDLAARTLDGTVPRLERLRRMEDQEIVERLTAVRGVGRWTVEMLLMFRLGRPDILPIDDLGIRKGFARAFGRRTLPTPAQLLRHGERWRPHRTIASWYLWRVLDAPDDD